MKDVLIYISSLIILIGIMYLMRKPFKLLAKASLRTLIGCGVLLVLNTFGTTSGIYIAVNFITAFVCGLLGIPGLCVLIALEHFV